MSSLSKAYISKIIFDNKHLSVLRQLDEYLGKQELYCRKSPSALDALRQHAVIESVESSTCADIAATCPDVSGDTIRNVIRQLRDEGTIASTGTGRNAKWCKTTLV